MRNKLLLVLALAVALSGTAVAALSVPVITMVPGTVQGITCPTTLKVISATTSTIAVLCEALPPTATPAPPTPTPVPPTPVPPVASYRIWLSHIEIMALPVSGAAWDKVNAAANGSWGTANLSDLNANHDVYTLAGALVYDRLGSPAMKTKVEAAIHSAIGTESSSRGLEVSRNIVSYVIAADLIGYREPGFVSWLSALRTKPMTDGRSIVSTQEDRPNNWGTMASAARIAIDLYLGDAADLARATTVFKGYLGDRAAYAGFSYGELSWQADPAAPVGINPMGATKQGLNIDGVLPDDQRRTGGFTTSPPLGSYPFEALQGVMMAAQLLQHSGQPVYAWSDQAILRAWTWLYTVPENGTGRASGDDSMYPVLVNHAYGTNFALGTGGSFGKNGGWFEWTHGS